MRACQPGGTPANGFCSPKSARGRAFRTGRRAKKTAGKGPPQRFVFHFFASALPAPGVRAEKREKREDFEAPEQHIRREHEL